MRWKNSRRVCLVISTNDLFNMMIIWVCAAAHILEGSEKAEIQLLLLHLEVLLLLQLVKGCYLPHLVSHHSHQEQGMAISIIFLQNLCEWYWQFPQLSPLDFRLSFRLALLEWKMLIQFNLHWEPGHLRYLICFLEKDSGKHHHHHRCVMKTEP